MKKILSSKSFWIVVVGLVLILLGIYLAWNYIVSTPQYSMLQLQKAVKVGDVETVEQYIDIDALSDQIIEVVSDRLKDEIDNKDIPVDDFFGKDFYSGLITLMLPSMKEELGKSFETSLEEFVKSKGQPSADSEGQVVFLQKLDDKNIYDLFTSNGIAFARNGDFAIMTIRGIQGKSGEVFDIKLKLERVTDKRWKIVAWENLAEILENVIDTSKLKPSGESNNTPSD